MAKAHNHSGKYGTNANGKDKFRNVQNPDKLMNAVDLADFQFNKGSIGITDVDGCINLGNRRTQINIFVEFKENTLTSKLQPGYKHEAIPEGQRIALENLANGVHMTTAHFNDTITDLGFRNPGTASVILLVSHPDEWYPSGAEGMVEAVYWANDHFSKDRPGWQVPVAKDKPAISLAQYIDALSALLEKEVPEGRATKLFRNMGKAALKESGQQSRLIP